LSFNLRNRRFPPSGAKSEFSLLPLSSSLLRRKAAPEPFFSAQAGVPDFRDPPFAGFHFSIIPQSHHHSARIEYVLCPPCFEKTLRYPLRRKLGFSVGLVPVRTPNFFRWQIAPKPCERLIEAGDQKRPKRKSRAGCGPCGGPEPCCFSSSTN